MFKYLILCISLNIISAQECEKTDETKPITEEKRLRADLLCNYNKHFVPMTNRSARMDLAMSINIVSYSISDYSASKLHIENEITVSWNDAFLIWRPEDYNSITEILMSTDEIWSPEIMPEEMEFFSRKSSIFASTDCKLTSSGVVTCTSTSFHSGFCHTDDLRWPYNEYECDVQYMSITQDGEDVRLEAPSAANGTFTVQAPEPDAEWRITSHSDTWMSFPATGRNMRVVEVYMGFTVGRNVGGMVGYMFLSMIVLSSLSLLSFWANFESTDRVILCLINIICHMFEVQNMEYKFSRLGHTVPYILCFYRDSLIIALVILVETMVFKKILTSDKPTPNWLAIIGRNLGKDVVRKILFVEGATLFDPKTGEPGSFEDELQFIKQSNQLAKKRIIQILDRLVFVIFFVAYFSMGVIILTF